ncbi:DNA polymerase III subunit gamma/tau [Flavisolibacter ginsengisoli]|jgi:DNA polymerase-3 subunit gamma/tau|uniref:DNA polymerase III subunit gamma/tau n=1 Tax=Flavisolibacter ginsengisoli DSM 18119 TaxID=1121884 RepID=A0A1M5CR08_9BACT|nr:DNA polymerase III subunit gamma/tau [Flavisolibacter ginsengisoli]SHF57170.1 DNA polymerase-3 subunit gamma/tau [Flavisolibacter ginsengisoli DSM 18119]
MEKFIVSARKYRPQTFDTVVGQDHITTTLKNAIKSGHLAHAFLFCGPRGVGKTTCARILAKTINCENPSKDGEACNECHSCRSFNEGTSMNIHELDAASNNSVEDIRSLVEQVRFAPQAGKYKVYIIDEVHMLSSAAFNAFLKTLEEPPPYAIFILATTEKHKILPTILSRCQIFDFKRITLQDTVDHLEGIANKEHIKVEETALQLISQKSEGCMRDALSILDKIVSFTNGEVTYENTIEHLNILDADYYFKLVECMLNQDLAGAMLLYDDIDKKGFEGDMVLNGFAEFIRNLLICKDERVAGLLEVVESFRQRYAETAKRTEAGYLVSALNILNEAEISFRSARNKRLHVELALIKLCYLHQAIELTSNGGTLDKKKVVDGPKSIAFRNITPLAQGIAQNITKTTNAKDKKTEAKLIIETPTPLPTPMVEEKKEVYKPPPPPVTAVETKSPAPTPVNGKKISSLNALRQKIGNGSGVDVIADKPLDDNSLKEAWDQFIINLKASKNPAWQSFETARLNIKDNNSFEAIVTNNINQKFLELERNKACEFLQAALQNRQLQFIIVLQEGVIEHIDTDRPLSSKEQYQKIIEQFPLVKELRERLRLELDY